MIRTRALVISLAMMGGCEREERPVNLPAAASDSPRLAPQTNLQAGPMVPSRPSPPRSTVQFDYNSNAYGMSEGQLLFEWFNCTGCHAHGGGDIGPPLIDDKWIYGSDPEDIYTTIMEGRPNGMPSYGGRLVNDQAWKLVAYVRSMSGLNRIDASPGRTDHMKVKPPEHTIDRAHPQPDPEHAQPLTSAEAPP